MDKRCGAANPPSAPTRRRPEPCGRGRAARALRGSRGHRRRAAEPPRRRPPARRSAGRGPPALTKLSTRRRAEPHAAAPMSTRSHSRSPASRTRSHGIRVVESEDTRPTPSRRRHGAVTPPQPQPHGAPTSPLQKAFEDSAPSWCHAGSCTLCFYGDVLRCAGVSWGVYRACGVRPRAPPRAPPRPAPLRSAVAGAAASG